LNYFRDDLILSDILSLVSISVSPEVISGWTDSNCEEAEEWAACMYLKASDNYGVKIPKEPKFLAQYKKV
jgi:hypothetical protein